MRALVIAVILVSGASVVAQEGEPTRPGSQGRQEEPTRPGGPGHQEALVDLDAPALVARFGTAESEWITVGAGAAWDFGDSTDVNVHAAYSTFLVDDVELAFEFAAWYASQEGEDALGLNPSLVFRHHLVNEGDWTFYLDAGIGAVVFTDKVPANGTAFNFTPKAGLGVTYALDDATRLQLGLRWHHYSNARIEGEEKNPARDGPMLYAGIVSAW